MSEELWFDFDFGSISSDEMLSQARRELLDLQGVAGVGNSIAENEEVRRTKEFFDPLEEGTIEFPKASPTVIPLNIKYFKQNKLAVPKNFAVLSAEDKFFWVEVPIFLVSGPKPFYKLQVWMGFGVDTNEAKLLPKIHSAFPASEFAKIATVRGKVDLGLGEDLSFKVAAGIDKVTLPTNIPIIAATAGGKLGVHAKLASDLGIVAGPFSYTVKRALIDCRFAGERVLWTVLDKQSLQEDPPIFVVILRVPMEITQVQLKARVQAHRAAPLPRFFMRLLDKVSPERADWLKQGSPISLPLHSYTIDTK